MNELDTYQPPSPAGAFLQVMLGIIFLLLIIVGLIAGWSTFLKAAPVLVQILVILVAIAGPGAIIAKGAKAVYLDIQHARSVYIRVKMDEEQLQGMEDARWRENQRAEAEAERIRAEAARIRAEAEKLLSVIEWDAQGNAARWDPQTRRVIQLQGQMREHPALHSLNLHYDYKDTSTQVSEEKQQLLPAAQVHIPTFAESLAAGEIGPGQRQVLICYELVVDETTGRLTGEIIPRRDQLENNCTMFLGGSSKSGKSTLMTNLAAQEAMMDALFYCIDPHLTHPERSIAVKLAALSHAFILPPAMTDADVYTVLQHAKAEAEARLNGRETRLSGHPIVFIVDEVLNLIGRAQRSDNADVQRLYRELAHFMRDLGTQYNKFSMNGIFASQYVTKDAFRLPGPGGNVDFRDGCQSQGLLRLPPNQAQAMRLLQSDELREMRTLPPGHGYMGFYTGDIIRMAFGNVTVQDINQVGHILDSPSPLTKRQFAASTWSEPPGTRSRPPVQMGTERTDYPTNVRPFPSQAVVIASTAQPAQDEPGKTPEPGTERVQQQKVKPKEFTPEQELEFIKLYAKKQDIKACLSTMRLGIGTYYTYASQLVERRKLRRA